MIFGDFNIIVGDCRDELARLPERHFHTCVTSPPYFGLRDYGVDGQIGLEPTPDDFVAAMRAVFGGAENPVGVWRVLRDDGVLWLNLGDSYNSNPSWGRGVSTLEGRPQSAIPNKPTGGWLSNRKTDALKSKDLMGMPWRVAFALQADGWYLRDAIIWHKPAPMPGSQRDRCTSAYEFIFQLAKRPAYFFDMEAIKEKARYEGETRTTTAKSFAGQAAGLGIKPSGNAIPGSVVHITDRTPRNVWRIASEGFSEAHFATYPREIPLRCIKAATSEKGCCAACGAPYARVTEREARKRYRPNDLTKRTGENGTGNHYANTVAGVDVRTVGWEPGCDCGADVARCRVLDPFNGAGTTGVAACLLGRDYTGIELNPEYAAMAERRIRRELRPGTFVDESKPDDSPLFAAAERSGK